MRRPSQAPPVTTVYLVFARSGPGDGEDVVEPLVAVVTDESEAAGLERSVVARHPMSSVSWETHDTDGPVPTEGVVHVVLLGAPELGMPDAPDELAGPIGIAVRSTRGAAERVVRDRGTSSGDLSVVSLQIGYRRAGWPFAPWPGRPDRDLPDGVVRLVLDGAGGGHAAGHVVAVVGSDKEAEDATAGVGTARVEHHPLRPASSDDTTDDGRVHLVLQVSAGDVHGMAAHVSRDRARLEATTRQGAIAPDVSTRYEVVSLAVGHRRGRPVRS
ncbi:hypothetical protein [Janibacter melonis]|uniref:hypothetical protein n=1 Tax=Janibacter melonis TaxID=262209 RepID=UPI002096198E|nr:hypothetical protein [Janibacter melonis]